MTDDLLRKEKYKCVFNGSPDMSIGDLFFKSPNPIYSRRVTLKKGEYILTELLDFEDLKKSRLHGALGKFIEMGWIVVESPSVSVVKKETETPAKQLETAPEAITELQAGIIQAKDISNKISTSSSKGSASTSNLGFPIEAQTKTVESLSIEKSRTINSLAISETAAQKAPSTDVYDKFIALRYFQKLKTIKETRDQGLLSLIISKSNYPQLIYNSKNRLRELTTGR